MTKYSVTKKYEIVEETTGTGKIRETPETTKYPQPDKTIEKFMMKLSDWEKNGLIFKPPILRSK